MSGYFSRLLSRASPGGGAIRPALDMLGQVPAPEPETAPEPEVAAWPQAPAGYARMPADRLNGSSPAIGAQDSTFDAELGRDEGLVLAVELPLSAAEPRASANSGRGIPARPERRASDDFAAYGGDSLTEPHEPERLEAPRAPFTSTTGRARVTPPDALLAPRAERLSDSPRPPAPRPNVRAPEDERTESTAAAQRDGAPFAAAFTAPRSGLTAAPAASDVHVTIGRIEIHATHGTPAPKRGSAERRPAQSLDAYLARRKRGGA